MPAVSGYFRSRIPVEPYSDPVREQKRRAMAILARELDNLWSSIEFAIKPEYIAEVAVQTHSLFEEMELAVDLQYGDSKSE